MGKVKADLDQGYVQALKDPLTGPVAGVSAMHVLMSVYGLIHREGTHVLVAQTSHISRKRTTVNSSSAARIPGLVPELAAWDVSGKEGARAAVSKVIVSKRNKFVEASGTQQQDGYENQVSDETSWSSEEGEYLNDGTPSMMAALANGDSSNGHDHIEHGYHGEVYHDFDHHQEYGSDEDETQPVDLRHEYPRADEKPPGGDLS